MRPTCPGCWRPRSGRWAPPEILDAYEAERRPITEQVSRYAMNHAIALSETASRNPDDIEEQSEQGAAARARIRKAAYAG